MKPKDFKKVIERFNNFLLYDIDTAPDLNVYPNSLLSWKSTREHDYLKFLVNKNMSITNMGISNMLEELKK